MKRKNFNPFGFLRGTQSLTGRLMGTTIGGPSFQNYLSSVSSNPSAHPFGSFLNAPAPILGLMAGGAARILGNGLRNWHYKPEEKFVDYYHTVEANPFTKAPYSDLVPELPRIKQLAQHAKHLGPVPFHDDHRAPGVKKNQAFVHKNKPFIMLDKKQANDLGFNVKGDRYGVALNRYANARSALSHRNRVKAEENRGR